MAAAPLIHILFEYIDWQLEKSISNDSCFPYFVIKIIASNAASDTMLEKMGYEKDGLGHTNKIT